MLVLHLWLILHLWLLLHLWVIHVTPGRLKTRGRGPGVWGPGVFKTRGLVENTGSQWKTRGLSARHSGTIISPNNEV